MKPFNVHYNPNNPGKLPSWCVRRGFTAHVSEHPDPKRVTLHFAFCSKKDEFNRKVGLSTALAHAPINVAKKQLPSVLKAMAKECWKDPEVWVEDFNYVLRNFV